MKIKRNTVAKLSVSGQLSRKGPFRSVGAIYYTRCSHTLTFVIDANADTESSDADADTVVAEGAGGEGQARAESVAVAAGEVGMEMRTVTVPQYEE